MDITAFIRELLFSHDCVIVPGFGGFIGNYTPARIDKSSSTFFPPVKQITFNRNLNHNDGLLVGRISESAKMNYGDARNLVEEYVASVRKRLEKGEKIVFDNIGSFINNQEGNIQFEPDTSVNYHLDSFGLESFNFQPLENYDVRRRVTRHIDKDPAKQSSMRKILWRAAIIVPLLAVIVAVTFKTNIFKSKVEATSLNPLASAEFGNNKSAVDEKAASTKDQSEKVPANPEVVISDVSSIENYCIITGSFRLKENAEAQVEMLRKEGFTPEILNAPNGFFRVSAMKCLDMSKALGSKDSIGKKFPGSWVKKIL
jgi:nucleoid DNA-binding protein